MMLTDKCLAIATATLLIYGMVFTGILPSSGVDADHSSLTPRQAQNDMPRSDGANT